MKTDYIYDISAGRELDALIAEHVMGWIYSDAWKQLVPFGHADPPLWSEWEWDIDKAEFTKHPVNMMSGVSYRGDKPYIPEYSTDIAKAWEVVEKMGSYKIETMHHANGTKHRVSFWNGMMGFPVEAETAPLAICRSALLAMTHTSD